MIDFSGVRVHKHGAGSRRDSEPREMGRGRTDPQAPCDDERQCYPCCHASVA